MHYHPIMVDKDMVYNYVPVQTNREGSDPRIFRSCNVSYKESILKTRDSARVYSDTDGGFELRREKEKAMMFIEDENICRVFEMLLRELDSYIRSGIGQAAHIFDQSEFPVLDARSGARVIPSAGTLQYSGLSAIRVIPMGAIADTIRSNEECTLATIAMSYLHDADSFGSGSATSVLGIEYLLFKDFLVLSPIYENTGIRIDSNFDTKKIWVIASYNIRMVSHEITVQDGFLNIQYTNCSNALTQVLKVPFEEYNTEINFSNPLILGTLTRDAILGAVNMRDFSEYELAGISRILSGDEVAYEAVEDLYQFCSLEQFITDLYEVAFLLMIWDHSQEYPDSRVLRMGDYQYRSDKYLYIRNLMKLLDKAVCVRLKQQILGVIKYPDTYCPENTTSFPIKKLGWAIKYLNKYARPAYDLSLPTTSCCELAGKVPGLDMEGLSVLGVPPMFPTYEGMSEEDRYFLEDYTGNSPRGVIRQRTANHGQSAYKKTSLDLSSTSNEYPLVLDMGREGRVAILSSGLFTALNEGRSRLPGLRILWCSNANYRSIYGHTPEAAYGIVRDADTAVSVLKKLKPVKLEHLVDAFVSSLESGRIGASVIGKKYENKMTGLLPGSSRCASLLNIISALNFPLWDTPSNEIFAMIFKSTFMFRSSGSNGLGDTNVADDPGLAWGLYILKGILEKERTQVHKSVQEDARTWEIVDRYYAKNRR